MLVTSNLPLFLEEICTTNLGFLWIDAICINQNDNAEKSVQVQRMDLIYSNATQVIAWLGANRWTNDLGSRAFNYISTTPWPAAPTSAYQCSWFDASHEHSRTQILVAQMDCPGTDVGKGHQVHVWF